MFDWLNAVAKLSLSHRDNAYFSRIPVLLYLCISGGQAQARLGRPHDVIVPALQACMTLPPIHLYPSRYAQCGSIVATCLLWGHHYRL